MPKHHRCAFVAALFVAAVPIAAEAQPPGRKLAAVEIPQMFGKAHDITVSGGAYGIITIAADGKASLDLNMSGRKFIDTGEVLVRGDKVCTIWRSAREGRVRCWDLYLHNGTYLFIDESGAIENQLKPR